MKKIQAVKRAFASMRRRLAPELSRQLVLNIGTLVAVALMLSAYHAWAAPSVVPQADAAISSVNTGLLSYQGYLTDVDGTPLHGDVGITFRLYSVPTGGTALWTEAHTGGNTVPVDEGLFNVMLGSLTPIPSGVWDSDTLYLGVQVGPDAEMTPREMVGAVPKSLTVPDGSITQAKFSEELNLVSLCLFDNPPLVLDSGGWTQPSTTWSLLDLSAWVTPGAQAVILQILVDIDRENDGEFRLGFRKPGSTAANYHVLSVDGHYTPGHMTWTHNQGIVGVSASTVEWVTNRPSGSTLGRYYVRLVGYYH